MFGAPSTRLQLLKPIALAKERERAKERAAHDKRMFLRTILGLGNLGHHSYKACCAFGPGVSNARERGESCNYPVLSEALAPDLSYSSYSCGYLLPAEGNARQNAAQPVLTASDSRNRSGRATRASATRLGADTSASGWAMLVCGAAHLFTFSSGASFGRGPEGGSFGLGLAQPLSVSASKGNGLFCFVLPEVSQAGAPAPPAWVFSLHILTWLLTVPASKVHQAAALAAAGAIGASHEEQVRI